MASLRIRPQGSSGQLKNPEITDPIKGPDGKILKGKTLNPGGRFAWENEVREKLKTATATGVEFLQWVIEGRELPGTVDGKKIKITPSISDRLRAVEIAFNFAIMKPTAKVELSVNQNPKWIAEATKEEALKILENAREIVDAEK